MTFLCKKNTKYTNTLHYKPTNSQTYGLNKCLLILVYLQQRMCFFSREFQVFCHPSIALSRLPFYFVATLLISWRNNQASFHEFEEYKQSHICIRKTVAFAEIIRKYVHKKRPIGNMCPHYPRMQKVRGNHGLLKINYIYGTPCTCSFELVERWVNEALRLPETFLTKLIIRNPFFMWNISINNLVPRSGKIIFSEV